jgi:hypothetical protein
MAGQYGDGLLRFGRAILLLRYLKVSKEDWKLIVVMFVNPTMSLVMTTNKFRVEIISTRTFMKKTVLYISFFFLLILYNFLIVDKVSFHYNLVGGMEKISTSSTLSLISAILLAPIIEESVFRWALIRNNLIKYPIYMIISAILFLFINKFLGVAILAIYAMLLILKLWKNDEREVFFNIFILVSALSFCFVHIPVIKAETWSINVFISILAFLPIGIFFSLTRIQFGIKYSILSHAVYNSLILITNEVVY